MKVVTVENYIHKYLQLRPTEKQLKEDPSPCSYAWLRFCQERDGNTALYKNALDLVLKHYSAITHIPLKIDHASLYSRWVSHCAYLTMLQVEQYYIDKEEKKLNQEEKTDQHKRSSSGGGNSTPLESWKEYVADFKKRVIKHLDRYTMYVQTLRRLYGDSAHFVINSSEVNLKDKTCRFVYVTKSGCVKNFDPLNVAQETYEGYLVWPDNHNDNCQHVTHMATTTSSLEAAAVAPATTTVVSSPNDAKSSNKPVDWKQNQAMIDEDLDLSSPEYEKIQDCEQVMFWQMAYVSNDGITSNKRS